MQMKRIYYAALETVKDADGTHNNYLMGEVKPEVFTTDWNGEVEEYLHHCDPEGDTVVVAVNTVVVPVTASVDVDQGSMDGIAGLEGIEDLEVYGKLKDSGKLEDPGEIHELLDAHGQRENGSSHYDMENVCLVKNRDASQWEEIWWAAEQMEPLPAWIVEAERAG